LPANRQLRLRSVSAAFAYFVSPNQVKTSFVAFVQEQRPRLCSNNLLKKIHNRYKKEKIVFL